MKIKIKTRKFKEIKVGFIRVKWGKEEWKLRKATALYCSKFSFKEGLIPLNGPGKDYVKGVVGSKLFISIILLLLPAAVLHMKRSLVQHSAEVYFCSIIADLEMS